MKITWPLKKKELFFLLPVSILFALISGSIQAAESARIIDNPPPLKKIPKVKALLKSAQFSAQPVGHEVSLDLNIIYTTGKLWNPAVGRADTVKLRSYQGTDIDPNTPFISPMIDINPGDTVRINLHNKLPADPSCTQPSGNINIPHCFNGTNLHTHGLWVNPAGNSDNVLITVDPGVNFEYEYNIPSDHPAGTFWYHTHNHGSTALQVSSGMAGALIIRGNRLPTATENGDIDTLLRPTPTQSFKERVLVMQQIQYACRDAKGKVKVNKDGTYKCDKDDVGGIESYDQFGPGSWPASGRYTSINGVVLPTFDKIKAGDIERWRIIHGGVRDTINLEFRKMKSVTKSALLRADANDKFIGENCTGEPIEQHLIAADGLTLGKISESLETIFQPAYRWDILLTFPQAGKYCVIDTDAEPSASVNQTAPSRQLLGFVDVSTGKDIPEKGITDYLKSELISAAEINLPTPVREKVIADLRDDLKLSSFVPHPDIKDSEVTGSQELVFNIDVNTNPVQFQVGNKLGEPVSELRPFDPSRIDRTLILGNVDEWKLQSDFVSHPFHIHVNPFQVVKILDPEGRDVTALGVKDDRGGCAPADTEYSNLKGVWKDTLWVKNSATSTPPEGTSPECKKILAVGQYTIVMRTRYQRYIGDYVLHCHILDHEDQGMMQIIRVALPNGAGGVSTGHHH